MKIFSNNYKLYTFNDSKVLNCVQSTRKSYIVSFLFVHSKFSSTSDQETQFHPHFTRLSLIDNFQAHTTALTTQLEHKLFIITLKIKEGFINYKYNTKEACTHTYVSRYTERTKRRSTSFTYIDSHETRAG